MAALAVASLQALAGVAFAGNADGWQGAPLSTLRGESTTLAALRDRPVLVNFWARWCVPCREELPALARAQRDHPGLRVLGIALDDDAGAVREFAAAYEAGYPMLMAGADVTQLLEDAGDPGAAVPFTVAIDARGVVLARHLGALGQSDLSVLIGLLEGSRR